MNEYDLDQLERSTLDSFENGDYLPPDVYWEIIARLIEEIRIINGWHTYALG